MFQWPLEQDHPHLAMFLLLSREELNSTAAVGKGLSQPSVKCNFSLSSRSRGSERTPELGTSRKKSREGDAISRCCLCGLTSAPSHPAVSCSSSRCSTCQDYTKQRQQWGLKAFSFLPWREIFATFSSNCSSAHFTGPCIWSLCFSANGPPPPSHKQSALTSIYKVLFFFYQKINK